MNLKSIFGRKKKALFNCPCCGRYDFKKGPGSHDICPVCNWEDDRVQYEDPDFEGGANKKSLNECKKFFSQKIE